MFCMSLRPHYFLFPVSCHYLSSFDLCLLSGLGGLLSSCWITDLTFQRFKNFLPAKEYVKAVYCHPAYLTYMQSTCMHAKSLQSCPTLCDPVDCSLPGSSVHGFSSGKNTGVGCSALLQGIFPTQGSNPHLLHITCIGRRVLYH